MINIIPYDSNRLKIMKYKLNQTDIRELGYIYGICGSFDVGKNKNNDIRVKWHFSTSNRRLIERLRVLLYDDVNEKAYYANKDFSKYKFTLGKEDTKLILLNNHFSNSIYNEKNTIP